MRTCLGGRSREGEDLLGGQDSGAPSSSLFFCGVMCCSSANPTQRWGLRVSGMFVMVNSIFLALFSKI